MDSTHVITLGQYHWMQAVCELSHLYDCQNSYVTEENRYELEKIDADESIVTIGDEFNCYCRPIRPFMVPDKIEFQ